MPRLAGKTCVVTGAVMSIDGGLLAGCAASPGRENAVLLVIVSIAARKRFRP